MPPTKRLEWPPLLMQCDWATIQFWERERSLSSPSSQRPNSLAEELRRLKVWRGERGNDYVLVV
jgi:hypothetical protein